MQRGNLSRLLQSSLFTTFVRLSPWEVSFYLLWLVTVLYFLVDRENREAIRSNVREVFGPHRDSNQVETLFRSIIRGIFRHYFEKLYLAYSTNEQWKDYFLDRMRVSGLKNLDQFLAKNKGLILVTAHFGGVEFLPGFLTLLGYRVAIIARFKTQRLKERCEEKARKLGATIIDASEKNSFFLALNALRQGRILITECDEVSCWRTDPRRAVRAFGTSFHVDRTPAILQRRSGAPVAFGYVRREGGGRYSAVIEDISGRGDLPPERIGETILRRLEKLVYSHPDQWYIWKDFQLMKANPVEEIAVEDRVCRNLRATPPAFAIVQSSRTLAQLHRQYCDQASV
jgi:KDO2-lipid IV(A) lauroyltransferase